MVSKVLFLVLVGCAFALAKPVDDTEVAEVEKPKVEVVEISEEEAKEIFKELEEKFKNIWGKVSKPTNPGDFENVFEEIQGIFDKIFAEHKHPQLPESAETVETVESVESAESQKPVEEDVPQETQE